MTGLSAQRGISGITYLSARIHCLLFRRSFRSRQSHLSGGCPSATIDKALASAHLLKLFTKVNRRYLS